MFCKRLRDLFYFQGRDRLDRENILDMLKTNKDLAFYFRTVAKKFRLIDDNYRPVVVYYGESPRWIAMLKGKDKGPKRWLLRKLQRYVVNLPQPVHAALVAARELEEVVPDVFAQVRPDLYDDVCGFVPDKAGKYDSDDLVI